MVQMLIKRWIVRRSKGLIIGYVTDLQQPALYPAWHWVICPASDDVLADYMQKVGESQEELSAEMDYVTEYYTSHSCSPMHGISQRWITSLLVYKQACYDETTNVIKRFDHWLRHRVLHLSQLFSRAWDLSRLRTICRNHHYIWLGTGFLSCIGRTSLTVWQKDVNDEMDCEFASVQAGLL